MKLSRMLVLISFSSCIVFAEDSLDSMIQLGNHDVLSGSVESIDGEWLVWKSPMLEKPATFLMKNVIEFRQTVELPQLDDRSEALVRLTNGDAVRGQLAAVSADSIALDTGFAGRMTFKRLMVESVTINEPTNFLFKGPSGLNGWRQSGESPAWTYRHSMFTSKAPGGIARDVGLPDECRIAFDAAWDGGLGLKLILFSNDTGSDHPTSGYEVTFQQRSVYLRRCNGQKFLGHTPNVTLLEESEEARIEICASLKSGKFCLLVDGKVVDVWTDSNVVSDSGGGVVHFISTSVSPVEISGIRVSKWDGELDPVAGAQVMLDQDPGPRDDDTPIVGGTVNDAAGRMELRNGDTISGEVVSIEKGMVIIRTAFSEVAIPLERLRAVALNPVSLERCKRLSGDVRGHFADGSFLVFHLDGMEGGFLMGSSQNFGKAKLNISSFARVEFNIYRPSGKEGDVAQSR
jgi:hypothetical protein